MSSTGKIAIRTDHLTRHYQMGAVLVRAAYNLTLGSPGRVRRDARQLRLRQIHADESDGGPGPPDGGSNFAHDRDLAQMSSEELAKHRSHTVGIVFQAFNLLPRMTLEENVEFPLRLAEVDRTERTRASAKLSSACT